MRSLRLFLLAPALLTTACAIETVRQHDDDNAVVLTQVAAEPLAACIAQKFGVTASPAAKGGFAIEAPGEPPFRLLVARDAVQTVVSAPLGAIVPPQISNSVIQCTLALTPPARSE